MHVLEIVSIIFVIIGFITIVFGLRNSKTKANSFVLGMMLLLMALISGLEILVTGLNSVIYSKLIMGVVIELAVGVLLLIIGIIRKARFNLVLENLEIVTVTLSLIGILLLVVIITSNYTYSLVDLLIPIVVILLSALLELYLNSIYRLKNKNKQ